MRSTILSTPSTPGKITSGILPVPHGMFRRHGGISSPPLNSLNLSYGVQDQAENVRENRRRIKKALAIEVMLSARQVHGTQIFCAEHLSQDEEVSGCDALITSQPGVGLLIQQADCQAILLLDPVNSVIAAIHCGWRGNVLNIIASTVSAMSRKYHTDPTQLLAVISPSLGPCCAEFRNFRSEFPEWLHNFKVRDNYFDLQQASRYQLLQAGVDKRHIDIISICTMCGSDYFSHRRATKKGQPTTGRQGSIIMLAA
jgi:polyphenol oxidase